MPNQSKIINGLNRFLKAKDMPLMMEKRGICSGLVIKYLIACGKENKSKFFEDNSTIAQISRDEYSAKEVKMKLASRDIEYAFQPFYYHPRVRQSDLNIISAIFNFPTVKTYNFGYGFTLESLDEALKQIVNDGDMIHLSSIGHAIGLYKKNGNYYLYDPNYDEEIEEDKAFNNTSELAKEIFERFRKDPTKPLPVLQEVCFSVFRAKSDLKDRQKQIKYPDKKQLIDKLIAIDGNRVDLTKSLQCSCYVGDTDATEIFLEKNADPLVKNEDYFSALMIAAAYGNIDQLNLICKNPKFSLQRSHHIDAIFASLLSSHPDHFKYFVGRLNPDSVAGVIKDRNIMYQVCIKHRADLLMIFR